MRRCIGSRRSCGPSTSRRSATSPAPTEVDELAEQPHGAVDARRPGGAERPRRHPRVPARQHEPAARRDAHRPRRDQRRERGRRRAQAVGRRQHRSVDGRRLRRDVRRQAGPARPPPIGPGRRLPAMAARQPRGLLRDRCGRADRRQLPPQPCSSTRPASCGPIATPSRSPQSRSSPATSRTSWPSSSTTTCAPATATPVMSRVLESKYRPSKKLLDHTAAMIEANSEFVLLDEQRVAFESVLAEARDGYHDAKKSVVLVQGGPGTGKSIIALHLVGELAKRGYNASTPPAARPSPRTCAASSASAPAVAVPLLQPVRQRATERRRRPDPRRGASAAGDSRQPLHAEGASAPISRRWTS